MVELIGNVAGLRAAQAARRAKFDLRRVNAAEAANAWCVRDGALQHHTASFFSVTGFRNNTDGTEHLLLYQPQGAITGFATRRQDGHRLFLVQARAEPGNVDEVQFGPSLQSTPANYMRLHGGDTSPFARMFVEHGGGMKIIHETQQSDQGKRYACKTKRASFLEVDSVGALATGFHWATADALVAAIGEDYLLNTDFTSMLSTSPWSSEPSSGELCPRSNLVRESLLEQVRPIILGSAIVAASTAPKQVLETIPIESLSNWRITEQGIEEVTWQQGWSIIFVNLEADAREVPSWTQPLIAALNEGLAVLACRVKDDCLEVFVSFLDEVGLTQGRGFGPSLLCYPGEDTTPPQWLKSSLEQPWITVRTSDEGGRFYHHRSRYTIVMVEENTEPSQSGVWLKLSELKAALLISNLCTIQLRGLAALLLAAP
jgi:oxidase EvaA